MFEGFAVDALNLPISALAAVLLDRLLGEPKKWHPLVGFGRLAQALEQGLNRQQPGWGRLAGIVAWAVVVLPWLGLAIMLRPLAPLLLDVALLYFALGARSLSEHAAAVHEALAAGQIDLARQRVGWIVSRDTSQLDESGIAKATVETVLENGNDAVFGAIFWFALFGGPGALLFRLANTLDAMWGYRNPRFQAFGWAAARLDDALNWLPARLTALTYAVLGHTSSALSCWRQQAPHWDSPNAGPVMAAGAGSLAVQLGGAAIYHGQEEQRPALGLGAAPQAGDIDRALRLVKRGMAVWLLALFLLAIFLNPGVMHA